MIIAIIILGVLSALFLIIGYLLGRKEKIDLLHSYHYDKVTKENQKAFCALSGFGIISIGIGMLISAVLLGISESLAGFIPFLAGFIIGLTLLIYAGKKYNS